MKARLIIKTDKGTIKSGKLDIETALEMLFFLRKNYPKHEHQIIY